MAARGLVMGARLWTLVKRCFRPPQSELKRLAVALRGGLN